MNHKGLLNYFVCICLIFLVSSLHTGKIKHQITQKDQWFNEDTIASCKKLDEKRQTFIQVTNQLNTTLNLDSQFIKSGKMQFLQGQSVRPKKVEPSGSNIFLYSSNGVWKGSYGLLKFSSQLDNGQKRTIIVYYDNDQFDWPTAGVCVYPEQSIDDSQYYSRLQQEMAAFIKSQKKNRQTANAGVAKSCLFFEDFNAKLKNVIKGMKSSIMEFDFQGRFRVGNAEKKSCYMLGFDLIIKRSK